MSTSRQRSSSASSPRKKLKGKAIALSTTLPQTPALRPAPDDRNGWKAYWGAQGQPWREEPEIDTNRQEELAKRRDILPDIEKGIYPFKGMKLSRADVEWLLATYENGHGPVDCRDEDQWKDMGLDLRGADLREEDLHELPLTGMRASLGWEEWMSANDEQREAAAIHLERSNLNFVHLEKAHLRGAHLESANLYGAHLEGTFLYAAHLEGASLKQVVFDGNTQLRKSTLSSKELGGASLADVRWNDVNITGIEWSRVSMLGEEQRTQLLEKQPKTRNSSLVNIFERCV